MFQAIIPLLSAGLGFAGKLMDSGPQTTTSHVDYSRLVREAEKAGFNPLTALRSGGSAGFQVTTHPALSSVGSAFGELGRALSDYDPQAEKRNQLELQLVQAQLENIQWDTKQRAWNFDNPAPRGAGGIVVNLPNTGAPVDPTVEQPTMTNPYKSAHIDPDTRDAESYEARYGDIGSNVAGVYVFGRDLLHNIRRQTTVARQTYEQRKKVEESWLPSWVPRFEFDWDAKPAHQR